MERRRNLILSLAGVLVLLLGFQNCGESFVVANDLSQNLKLASVSVKALFLINDGAKQTGSRSVQLKVAQSSGTELQVTPGNTCDSNQAWLPYSESVPHELTAGDGTKTVSLMGRKDGVISACVSATILLDTTPPEVKFEGEATAFISVRELTLAVTSLDAGSGLAKTECRADQEPFQTCPVPWKVSGLTDGAHRFEARAVDSVGNVSAVVTRQVTVDSQQPVIQVTGKPAPITNIKDATIFFNVSSPSGAIDKITCRVDESTTEAPCSASLPLTQLADGTHSVTIKATNKAGLASSTTVSWMVDTVRPTIAFTKQPAKLTTAVEAVIEFNAVDGTGSGIDKFECKLDNEPYAVCASPKTLMNLVDNGHFFHVKATDKAGNLNEAFITWNVDSKPPKVDISLYFEHLGSKANLSSTISTPSGLASKKCFKLLNGSETEFECGGTNTNYYRSFTGLAAGSHGIKIVATNNAGLTSTTVRNWAARDMVNPTSIAMRQQSLCMVVDGGIKCLGYLAFGENGSGVTGLAKTMTTLGTYGAGSEVTKISGGGKIMCGVIKGGVACWGYSETTLGDGVTHNSAVPVFVKGIGPGSGATDVSVYGGPYGTYACAIVQGGLKCWGTNQYGRLGTGDKTDRTTPVDVVGLGAGKAVTRVAAGKHLTCAIVGGGAQCWGYNFNGQLGDGTKIDRLTPTRVLHFGPGSGITEIFTGFYLNWVLVGSTVYAWGGANSIAPLGSYKKLWTLPSPVTAITGTDGSTAFATAAGTALKLLPSTDTGVYAHTAAPEVPAGEKATSVVIAEQYGATIFVLNGVAKLWGDDIAFGGDRTMTTTLRSMLEVELAPSVAN